MPADDTDGLALLGQAFALQQAGRLDDAEAAYAKVLAATPDDVTALINAGAVALGRGDVDRAIVRFARVTRLAPSNAVAHNNLGLALIQAGRDADALVALDRAIKCKPDYAQAHNNRGIALLRLARPADAVAAFERAAKLDDSYPEAALNLADQYNSLGDAARATAMFDRVLAAQPHHVQARTGRAFAQALAGDLHGAERALDEVTVTSPNHAVAWQTLGAVRNWAWDHAGAHDAFGRALKLAPNNADAAFGVASTLLARGDFGEGWSAFERRPDRGAESGAAFAQIPVWDGAPFAGTLVVYGEQGFGDVVQFARFLPAVRTRVQKLVLLLDGYRAPLAPLLANMQGVDAVVTRAGDVPAEGPLARASILSLPHRLGIGADRLSTDRRYLAPPVDRASAWRSRIAPLAVPRVGLAWSVLARDAHAFVTRHKSVLPSVLSPIVATPDVTFVTLQPGPAGDPAAFGPQAARIADMRRDLRDFADTAALIDTLDLVICADTAVAHIAGALGKPVWMLDRFNSCWRWRLAPDTTPWYPTMRIFRQPRFGVWAGVTPALTEAFTLWRAQL